MSFGQIGFPGANQLQPRINFQQTGNGAQFIGRQLTAMPVALAAGQSFVLPAGQWQVQPGRYTNYQVYDTGMQRWRNVACQPGQLTVCSSDGVNFRLANTTGTPVGAIISNVGTNGNATNGYNTITATISAGGSTWGTLVGGSVNTTVTVTTGGNFSLAPILVWQPAANQTFPYIPPTFFCNLSGNAIGTVTVNYGGAGLTGVGTLTAVNAAGDTNPGGAVLTFNATLTNNGNLTAIWPLTQGTNLTALPTFTFTGTNNTGMCANVTMDWTVSNYTVSSCGFNLGATKPVMILSGNGINGATQNAALTGTDYGTGISMPRPAWLSVLTDANSNISTNGNLTVIDAGKNLQAIPYLVAIPSNANGSGPNGNTPVVLTAIASGLTDTSYLQAF